MEGTLYKTYSVNKTLSASGRARRNNRGQGAEKKPSTIMLWHLLWQHKNDWESQPQHHNASAPASAAQQ
jgi:hypothetical protein